MGATRPVRWAIFGTGAVAGKFAMALRGTPGAELTVVGSRSPDAAQAFARQVGAARASTYEDAAAAPDVDVAYIATPPALHRTQALACIAAGKATLIEKPFAAGAVDAQAIVDAARAAKVFCMEAMWTRFLPALAAAREACADGRLGEVHALQASFAQPQKVDPHGSLFSPDLGGGALRHRGVYPISLALDLLGPARVAGASIRTGSTGVDEDVTALLDHGGATSRLYAGLRTSDLSPLTIYGDQATLRFVGPIYRPFGIEIEAARPRDAERWRGRSSIRETAAAQALRRWGDPLLKLAARRRIETLPRPYAGNGYGHQIEAVMACLSDGRLEHPLMTHDDTLAVARIVDEIRLGSGSR